MRTRTNTTITIVIAVVIVAILASQADQREPEKAFATESIPENESEAISRLSDLVQDRAVVISAGQATLSNTPVAHHGCARADVLVPDNLDPSLASEIFTPGAKYRSWLRFSNRYDPAVDSYAPIHSLGIRLSASSDSPPRDASIGPQDFILASYPVFLWRNAEAYARGLEHAAGKLNAPVFFNPLALQMKSYFIAKKIRNKQSQSEKSPGIYDSLLAMRWFSQLPARYGEGRAAKYIVAPCTRDKKIYGAPTRPDYLQRRLENTLLEGEVCLQLMVQLQSDPASMPIENPTIEWGEALSPFQPIAIMVIPQQDVNASENVARCESLRFNPWGNLPTHRPLGGISRAQRTMFEMLN